MRFSWLTLAFLLSSSAFAASFPCKSAVTFREKTVCSNAELSKADDQLAAAYASLRAQLSEAAFSAVQSDQRGWLLYLDKACAPGLKSDREDPVACLSGEYKSRLSDLTTSKPAASHKLYTRATYLALPSKLDPEQDSSADPGVGIGIFRWPQIDSASTADQAFNRSVLSFLLNNLGNSPASNSSFLSATSPDGSLDISWTLSAVNANLLSIDFEEFSMGYGAAHPLTTDVSFHWNRNTLQPLKAADIFVPSFSWSNALIQSASEKLRDLDGVADMMWQGKELKDGIRSGLEDTRSWTPTATGLSIRFGQYQVAAYAAGMPEITFSWSELRRYLKPSFQPDTLPKSLLLTNKQDGSEN